MNNDQMEKLPARLDALFLGGRKRSPSSSSAQSAAPVEKKTKLKVKRKEKLPATLESSARDARVLEQCSTIITKSTSERKKKMARRTLLDLSHRATNTQSLSPYHEAQLCLYLGTYGDGTNVFDSKSKQAETSISYLKDAIMYCNLAIIQTIVIPSEHRPALAQPSIDMMRSARLSISILRYEHGWKDTEIEMRGHAYDVAEDLRNHLKQEEDMSTDEEDDGGSEIDETEADGSHEKGGSEQTHHDGTEAQREEDMEIDQ